MGAVRSRRRKCTAKLRFEVEHVVGSPAAQRRAATTTVEHAFACVVTPARTSAVPTPSGRGGGGGLGACPTGPSTNPARGRCDQGLSPRPTAVGRLDRRGAGDWWQACRLRQRPPRRLYAERSGARPLAQLRDSTAASTRHSGCCRDRGRRARCLPEDLLRQRGRISTGLRTHPNGRITELLPAHWAPSST